MTVEAGQSLMEAVEIQDAVNPAQQIGQTLAPQG
jgi:hypothetical protein